MGFLAADYPADAGIRAQFHHLRYRFIDWGVSSPDKRKALRQLDVSVEITEASQDASQAMFYNLQRTVEKASRRVQHCSVGPLCATSGRSIIAHSANRSERTIRQLPYAASVTQQIADQRHAISAFGVGRAPSATESTPTSSSTR
jgi:hypothetical protein